MLFKNILMNSNKIRFASWLGGAVCAVLLFGGCSLWEQFFPKEDRSPRQLMQEGLQDLQKGSYTDASEAFQKIKDRYPYSPFAVEAELRLGDALYKRRLFADAYDVYDDFVGLHPTNQEVPYAMYQKGMCHFSQIKTIDRDQSHTRKAKEDFELLVRRFPKSRYADRARRKIRECYIALAEHELYVGHFYFKRGDYLAAMGRYRFILENYPDLGQYKEALEYLQRCKRELRKEESDF